MVDSIINCADPAIADAVLIGVPYQRGASFGAGAARGPQAIVACLDRQIELFERHTRTEPAYRYRIAQQTLDEIDRLAPEDMVARVADAVAQHRAFAVVLGGTHAVSIGALRAHAARGRRARRHRAADRRPSRPARRRFRLQRARPQPVRAFLRDAPRLRDGLSDLLGRHSGVRARRVPVRRRSWPAGVRVGQGAEPAIEEILAAITTERVYLTVDVDGFDPAVAPATGTPVPGGLSWAYGTRLVRELFRTKDVIGADIVEAAPVAGSGLTEYAAAQLCYDLLCYKLLKRDGELTFF